MNTEHPLRRLRLHLGLKQEPFANSIGVRQGEVSAWEAGKRRMRAETALKIMETHHEACRELGIAAGDLVVGLVGDGRAA